MKEHSCESPAPAHSSPHTPAPPLLLQTCSQMRRQRRGRSCGSTAGACRPTSLCPLNRWPPTSSTCQSAKWMSSCLAREQQRGSRPLPRNLLFEQVAAHVVNLPASQRNGRLFARLATSPCWLTMLERLIGSGTDRPDCTLSSLCRETSHSPQLCVDPRSSLASPTALHWPALPLAFLLFSAT